MTKNNNTIKMLTITAVVASLAGCATASKDIASSYVSPLQYQAYDCDQIAQESIRIQTRVTELGGRLDQAAANDQGIAVAGALLFWPALFFLGGTKETEAEYGRLKGEYDALQQQANLKRCASAAPATPIQTPATETTASAVTPTSAELADPVGSGEVKRYKLVPAT